MFRISLILLLFCGQAYAYETLLTVAKDGTAQYTSIQEAINDTKTFPWEDITIKVKNGVYEEKVNVYSWNTRVTIIGESRDNTIIRFSDHFNKINHGRNSTFHTYTMRVAGNDFTAVNLTIENTAGPVGQAVALHVEADRAAFYNVSLKGFQDTLYVAGEGHRSYFENCYVEGSVDFIFGGGTAYFNHCQIQSLRSDSYVTAASTEQNQPYGLVFNDCQFTAPDDVSGVYLGRPWRHHANTLITNSYLGKHIHPAGWHNWNSEEKEHTVNYEEIGNYGPGAAIAQRVAWAKTTADAPLNPITPSTILGNWQPQAAAPGTSRLRR